MKAIRWPGLIAFVVIVGGLIAGTVLFAGTITKSIMESAFTDLNNAKVDIDSVDITYSPLSMSVKNIQVTDPANPMMNSVQIGQARFAVSFGDLLFKKLIIDDMSLSDIQINTARRYSGALKKKDITDKSKTSESLFDFDMPEIDFPDLDDIMAREKLTAESLIEDLNKDFDNTQDSWKKIKSDVVNEQRWNNHKTRYEKIKKDFKGNFAQKLAAIKEAKKLRDDLKQESRRIKEARKQFNADTDRLERKYKAAKAAPKKDI